MISFGKGESSTKWFAFLLVCFCVVFIVVAKEEEDWLKKVGFDCPRIEAQPPAEDVNHLHFSDIKVIMALGDSQTAAFGMYSSEVKLDGFFEFRGDSFPIGGNKGQVTIPNMLEIVNGVSPAGPSKGKELPLDVIDFMHHVLGIHHPEVDHLNAAISGSCADSLVGQVEYILEQMKKMPEIDIENDWKLLNLAIGPNNLCRTCTGEYSDQPEQFAEAVQAALVKIQQNIPRVFVNLLSIEKIKQVYTLGSPYEYCMWIQRELNECYCMHVNDTTRDIMDENTDIYNQKMIELEEYWTNKNIKDFAVRVQPVVSDLDLSKFDISYVSGVDCFHPSYKLHQLVALTLWNSMQLPSGSKPRTPVIGMKPLCPTSSTYIQ